MAVTPAPAQATVPRDAAHAPDTHGGSHRIASIDIVRGVVMILMAIDHVRVYSAIPAGGPTAGVFLTRWVTHFVAPAFVFLAGTAAFLHGSRLRGRDELSSFLVTRGAWLIVLELTAIRLAWTFNVDFGGYLLAGVIWVIGLCMMLLAAVIHLPVVAIAAASIGLIFAHNLVNLLPPSVFEPVRESGWGWLAQVLYFGGPIQLGAQGPLFFVLYSVVPWIGVMTAGYAFGAVMRLSPERRQRISVAIGFAAMALFLVLRFADLYGDPRLWRVATGAPAWLSFLNTSKYPASLLFLLMTLGPTLLAVGLLEHARGPVAAALATFGRVPLFYYLLHIPVIHLAAIVVSLIRSGNVEPWLFANHPVLVPEAPAGYMWSLPLLYLVTIVVVAFLYVPCRWFARLKARRRDLVWLTYF